MRIRATVWAGLAAVLVLAVITALAYESIRQTFETNQRATLDGLVDEVRAQISHVGRMVSAEAELIAALPAVPKLVAAGSRDQLLEMLRGGYDIQHRRFGLGVEQLNSAGGHVVLRLHNPASFGDDFTHTRQIVVTVHTTGESQSGVEIGTSGLRVRGVAPIADAGKTVGSIEFGMEMGPVLSSLKAASNADYAVMVDDQLFRSLATSSHGEGGAQPTIINGLRVDSATDLPLIAKLTSSVDVSIAKDRRYGEAVADKVHYGTVTVPLLDYSGKAIGTIFVARSFESDVHEMRRDLALMIAMVAAGSVLMVAIILIVFRGMVLRPVTALAATARAWAEGKEAKLPKGGEGPVANLAAALTTLKAKGETATTKETGP